MDVSAALKVGDLRQAVVLAGESGLNRNIIAAEVMEVPDIGGWLTEGILIVSTFYSIKDQPQAQIDMFKSLIKANGAGLVIKIGRYVEKLPQEMYDLANKYHMPIIGLPVNVSFVHVLTVLFEKNYEERKSYENEQFQLMNQLMNTEVKSLKDFVNGLASITGENVYYENRDNRLVTYAKKERDPRRKTFHLLSPSQPLNDEQLLDEQVIEDDRIILPIDDAGERLGYLHIILKRSKALVEVLQDCMVSIKEQIKLLLLKDQYEMEKRYQRENHFISDLIKEKTISADHDMKRRIDEEPGQLYGLFALDFSDMFHYLQIAHETDPPYLIYRKLYEALDVVLPNTILYNEEAYVYGLYLCKDKQSRLILIDQLQKVVNQLENEFNCKVYCGISLAHGDLSDMNKALDEARLSLQTRNDMGLTEQMIMYEKMGINKILLQLKNDKNVLHLIDMTLDALKFDENNKNEELIQTLDIFLRENGNYSKTSEKLFIHRRTLKYRLQKIETTLNINLDDSDTRFLLFFLLKMRKIQLG